MQFDINTDLTQAQPQVDTTCCIHKIVIQQSINNYNKL